MQIGMRKATMEDLKKIQELNSELFIKEFREYDNSLNVKWSFEKFGENYFKDAIKDEYVVVATDNEEIVGYLAGSIDVEKSYNINKIAELDNMFIKESYRKCGVGTKLIQSFISFCNDKEISDIRVTASFKNKEAIQFYMKNGFEEFELTLRRKV